MKCVEVTKDFEPNVSALLMGLFRGKLIVIGKLSPKAMLLPALK